MIEDTRRGYSRIHRGGMPEGQAPQPARALRRPSLKAHEIARNFRLIVFAAVCTVRGGATAPGLERGLTLGAARSDMGIASRPGTRRSCGA